MIITNYKVEKLTYEEQVEYEMAEEGVDCFKFEFEIKGLKEKKLGLILKGVKNIELKEEEAFEYFKEDIIKSLNRCIKKNNLIVEEL